MNPFNVATRISRASEEKTPLWSAHFGFKPVPARKRWPSPEPIQRRKELVLNLCAGCAYIHLAILFKPFLKVK
jgi:hypothetical protein